MVGLNLLSLGFQNISLKYERAVAPWGAVRVHAGFMIPHETKFIENQLNKSSDGYDDTYGSNTTKISTEMNGWHIKPEFVFYTGDDDAPKGYYIGIYGKIDRYSLTLPVTVSAERWKATGGMNRLGGGMIMGYQWLIADKVSIDWYFLGLGVDSYTFDFTVKSNSGTITSIDDAVLNDVEDELNNSGMKGFKAKKVDNSTIKITSPSVLAPCFRFGLSVGYAF